MTAETLRGRTRRELETLARRKKVAGIRSLSKDELIAILQKGSNHHNGSSHPKAAGLAKGRAVGKSSARKVNGTGSNGTASNGSNGHSVARRAVNGHASAATNGQSRNDHSRNGHRVNGSNGHANGHAANGHAANGHRANGSTNGATRKVPTTRTNSGARPNVVLHAAPAGQDRLFATAVDAHWYDVRWSLTPGMLNRAEAFFGLDWRSVQPTIRIFDVTSDDGASTTRAFVRDEILTEQTDRWFVRVPRPDRMWLFEIGLLGPKGRFFPLAHGEPIGAPGPLSRIRRHGGRNGASRNGADEMSPVSSLIPHLVRAANRKVNGEPAERTETGVVQLQAELVVHGKADPGSELRLMKDRIPLSKDGTFELRLPIENGRVVIPVEHVSSDGAEQRTVILAIERSTRVLETQLLDETAE